MTAKENSKPGRLIVISGPSGAGKSTVVQGILETCPLPLQMSISATTRDPRPGEVEGRDYRFLSREEFQRRRDRNEFLECAEVFGRGHWYGTLKQPVTTGLKQGQWLILEIDVDGALQVIERFPEAITIFVHPGSREELERRLRNRGTETEESILRRLAVASEELKLASRYQHVVVNENVEDTVQEICSLLRASGE